MFEKHSCGQRDASRLPVFYTIVIAVLFIAMSVVDSFAGVYTEVRVGESVILTVPYQIKRYSVTVQQQTEDSSTQGVKIDKNTEPKSPALVQVIYAIPDKPGAGKLTNVSNPGIPGQPGEAPGMGKTEIKIDGQYPGKATLIVWDKDEKKQFFDINVVTDTTDLEKRINEIAKDDAPNLHITRLNNTIVISGSVSTSERKARIDILLRSVAYPVGSKEISYLQGGQTTETEKNFGDPSDKTLRYVDLIEVANAPQIDLQITVASIDRNALRELGINWAYVSRNLTIDTAVSAISPGLTAINNLVSGTHGGSLTTTGINGANVGVVHSPSGTQFLIKALASKGLARVLASPDLLVRDGEVGTFLAGGEFPVPVVQSGTIGGNGSNSTSISVEWKKFGVLMNMKPIVKEDGSIEINMENNTTKNGSTAGNGEENCGIEVSSLDFANAVEFSGFKIPALKTDRINTNVELKDGETFVVGGLINEEWTKNLDKVPLLGDIPIIGAFFRDQKLTRNERELVFFITPKMVKPMPAGTKPAIPGANEPTKEQDDAFKFVPMLPNSISMDPLKLK
jgi:pilus assembly protein CpaC